MNEQQKFFISAALFFVITISLALIVSQNKKTTPPTPDISETSEPDTSKNTLPSNTPGVPSNINYSSETESSEISYVDPSEEPSNDEISNESEAASTSIPPEELPYDPSNLMDLKPEDMLPSELDNYFKDSMFVGNSIAVHFSNYCSARRMTDKNFLGGAKFFSTYGFSAYLDLHGEEKYFPKYKGESLHTWEAVEKSGTKTVYFCLMGLTELWKYSYKKTPETTFESNRQVLEKIRERCPDTKIVVLSASYMVKSFNSSKRALNNYLISRFNSLALEWCNENGVDFIDVSTPFLVGDDMPDEYCRDPGENGQGCHIKNQYYSAWIAVLRNYAYQKQHGAWKNPDEMRILEAH